MAARIGTDDVYLFETPRPELLREISGIEPEPIGTNVRLDDNAGVRSIQRLTLADIGGGVVAELCPAELFPQARYLYAEGRSAVLISAARESGWSVKARPHLAFFTSPPQQRLYLNPQVDADEYARRWEEVDSRWIHQYTVEEVGLTLWPWLKECGYASADDEEVLADFISIVGRRSVHFRPGLQFLQRWDANSVQALGGRHELAAEVRRAVNGVLGAIGEPTLPVISAR